MRVGPLSGHSRGPPAEATVKDMNTIKTIKTRFPVQGVPGYKLKA